MTLPLVVLAIFSIGFGWLGISEKFPLIGGVIPNWFHEFVGSTLLEMPETLPFSIVPLLDFIGRGSGRLGAWLVGLQELQSRRSRPGGESIGRLGLDRAQEQVLLRRAVPILFVRPAIWVAETFTSLWMDRLVIDGFLHAVASLTAILGHFFRNYIDKPIVNGFGDLTGEAAKKLGGEFRTIQTGRIQQYMVLALVSLGIFGGFYYLMRFLGLF